VASCCCCCCLLQLNAQRLFLLATSVAVGLSLSFVIITKLRYLAESEFLAAALDVVVVVRRCCCCLGL